MHGIDSLWTLRIAIPLSRDNARQLAESQAEQLFPNRSVTLFAYSKAKRSERKKADEKGELKE